MRLPAERNHVVGWPGDYRYPRAARLVRKAVLGLSILLCLDELGVKGVLYPITVQSGSMLPTLWGPKWTTLCPGCGWPLAWDASSRDLEATLFRAVCPHCRARLANQSRLLDRPGERIEFHPGRRVWILRGLFRPVCRWDVVAVRDRSHTGPLLKRVVGLPGESPAVENGILNVNGQALARPWPVQKQMAVLLERLPAPGKPPLVLRTDGENAWLFRRTVSDYCFFHPTMDQPERPSANLILQAHLETVEPESELLLRARVGKGELTITGQSAARGGVTWHIRRGRPGKEEEVLRTFKSAKSSACRVALSLVDGRWLVVLDDQCVLDVPRIMEEPPEGAPVLELSVKRGCVHFRELAVFHVAPYQDGPVATGYGYALLGDDPHASVDSRHGGRLWRAEDIVGIVRPLPWEE